MPARASKQCTDTLTGCHMTKEEQEIKAQLETNEADKKDVVEEVAEEAEEKIDYEAELRKEKERADAAEKKLAADAFKKREDRRKGEESGEQEEKPLTARELQEILATDRAQVRKETQSEFIREKAMKLAGGQAEAELIVEIHKNRQFPSHLSLDEQLEESYAIANRKNILRKNDELKRALRSKELAGSESGATHREGNAAGEPRMQSQDREALLSAGFSWDGGKRAYKKSLAGGKMVLYNDPRTKKTWRESVK